MRASFITNSLGALIVAGAIVGYFNPVPGSFWGNTFFGIPYSIAVLVVPLAAATCAATASWIVRRRLSLGKRGAISRGTAIGAIAFLLFSIFHAVAWAITDLSNGGGLGLAAVTLVTVPFATILGGLFILPVMPVCCAVAVACEWLVEKNAA